MGNAKSFSYAALVCGILSVIFSFFFLIPPFPVIGLVLGILGTVLGTKGRSLSEENMKGAATAGLVLGIIGIVFNAFGSLCMICSLAGSAALGTALTSMY